MVVEVETAVAAVDMAIAVLMSVVAVARLQTTTVIPNNHVRLLLLAPVLRLRLSSMTRTLQQIPLLGRSPTEEWVADLALDATIID